MWRFSCVLVALVVLVTGCGPTPQEKFDQAERDLERAQSRLDNLLPAYNEAKKAAAAAVCKELTGTTLEESASAALAGLGDVSGLTAPPSATDLPVEGEKVGGKKPDDLDKAISGLEAMQKKQAALAGPVAKVQEVMAKINTPGTPENAKYEEKLKSMREVQTYERQQKRVESAQELVDELKEEVAK